MNATADSLQRTAVLPLESISPWVITPELELAPRLNGSVEADVAVIGGGITGLTTAFELASAGRSVVLVEAGRVAQGESALTTAHLTAYPDGGLQAIARDFDLATAAQVWSAGTFALSRIAAFVREKSVECDFRQVPAHLFTEHERGRANIESELDALTKIGAHASLVEMPSQLAIRAHAALSIEKQAQFHAGAYLGALARHAKSAGTRIFERTRAVDVEEARDRCRVVTEEGEVIAHHVVVATNVPINTRVLLQTKVASYRTYAITARLRGPMPSGLFWDDEDPYHYVRSQDLDGEKLLMVGGEDHRTGEHVDEIEKFERLLAWTSARFEVESARHRWSGQIVETVDGLPYIGRGPSCEHVWVATGYRGNGMTFGTFAGHLLAGRILGRDDEWGTTFDATRVTPVASALSYARENLKTAAHLVGDRLHPARRDPAALARGEGDVFVEDGHKVAISRDARGTLHRVSATCTHLGCVVNWNAAEGSWDCPCHGSRFGADGTVINGPAKEPLAAGPAQRSAEAG